MLIYTMPIDMQPSSGETSSSVQMPQKANSVAIETISRLSELEQVLNSSFSKIPNAPPSATTPRLINIGLTTVLNVEPAPPLVLASAMEIAAEYATRLTTSSSATTCNSVSTKSPRALVWRIVISVDAGAVAEASAASTAENAMFRPSTQ